MRGGSAPSAQSTSRGRHARPMKMSSSPDTSIATCTCARHTSTQQCPRGGAPPGLLGSRRRWSLVSWGGIGDVLDDELVLHVERPLDNRLPPCHTHTRTSESTVSDEHGQSRLRARAGYQRAVQRWARLEYQAHAEGPGVRVTRAGAGAVGRGSSQWPASTDAGHSSESPTSVRPRAANACCARGEARHTPGRHVPECCAHLFSGTRRSDDRPPPLPSPQLQELERRAGRADLKVTNQLRKITFSGNSAHRSL